MPPCSRIEAAAGEAVRAHAGEHHGEHAGAVDPGDGAKEHIDGRAAMILRRILVEVQRGRRARASGGNDFHVPVAARDVDGAGRHRLAFGAFAHAQAGSGR